MQISEARVLIDKIPERDLHAQLDSISKDVQEAILKIVHPFDAKIFKINPKPKMGPKGKTDKNPNGVNYLKFSFANHILHEKGWQAEDPDFLPNALYDEVCAAKSLQKIWGSLSKKRMDTGGKNQMRLFPGGTTEDLGTSEKKGWGKIDFIRKIPTSKGLRTFAVEWETGNVSSSHRSINKLISAMYFSDVIGGIMIVPMKELAKFLTQRVGNYEELAPYFPFWAMQERNPQLEMGYLEIIGILHDEEDPSVPYLPKHEDGNAFRFKGSLNLLG